MLQKVLSLRIFYIFMFCVLSCLFFLFFYPYRDVSYSCIVFGSNYSVCSFPSIDRFKSFATKSFCNELPCNQNSIELTLVDIFLFYYVAHKLLRGKKYLRVLLLLLLGVVVVVCASVNYTIDRRFLLFLIQLPSTFGCTAHFSRRHHFGRRSIFHGLGTTHVSSTIPQTFRTHNQCRNTQHLKKQK